MLEKKLTDHYLVVARHGETEWNREGIMQGREDSPLTKKGVTQAIRLAKSVNNCHLTKVYSSAIGRSKITARIVASIAGKLYVGDKRVNELDHGKCSGFTKKRARDKYSVEISKREENKWKNGWPGGESYKDAYERVRRFVKSEDLNKSIIIGHKSVNRTIVGAVAGLKPNEMLNVEQNHNEVILVKEDKYEIVNIKKD
jgi:probable phosphoglycerate mutase